MRTAPAIAVSSYRETYMDHMTYDPDDSKKIKHARPVATRLHGDTPSDDPTAGSVQPDEYLLNSPSSPLVFRQFRNSMNDWDQDDEGSVELASPPSRFTDPLVARDRKSIPATKDDDLDTLGISASCPSPGYRFLLAPTGSATGTSRDPPRPTLAPRSISLPVYTLSKLGVDVMSRPATPAWGEEHKDRPAERTYATGKPSHTHSLASASTTSLSLFRHRKLRSGSQSQSELCSPRSLSPAPSTSSSKQHPPANLNALADHLAALYPAPLAASLNGSHFAPTPLHTHRSVRPKVKTHTEPVPADTSPLPSPDKHPKLSSIKTLRRLMSRRSISSFDALSEASSPEHDPDHDESPSVETPFSYFDVGRLSAESKLSIERPEIKVFVPDERSDSPRMYTHYVVGDVWEECDLNDAIPVLRSMRSTCRI